MSIKRGVSPMMTARLFRTSRGKVECGVMIVDDEDADVLECRWRFHYEGYAFREVGPRASRVSEYAHRVVAERVFGPIPPGSVVDHVNHNRLDNRRSNLRVVSNEDNLARNRRPADFKTCCSCRTRSRKVTECHVCLMPFCPGCVGDHACEREAGK